MPIHDWSRVDASIFHHFHQRWTIAICDALNAGLLPPDARPSSSGMRRVWFETTAYVEPVGVGDTLPDMPAYITRGGHVPVPLEAAYQAAWASCPADLRELVETGKLSGEGE